MAGVPLRTLAFSVPPTLNLHAFFTLLSYNDHVTVTVTADSALFSEEVCATLLEHFNQELVTLVEGAQVCVCLFESRSGRFARARGRLSWAKRERSSRGR